MNKVVISGFLALVGTLWVFAVGSWANQHLVDAATYWGNSFFITTLAIHPIALLLFLGGVLLLGFGLVSLIVEYFRK